MLVGTLIMICLTMFSLLIIWAIYLFGNEQVEED